MRTKPYWTLFGVARGGCPTRRTAPRRGGVPPLRGRPVRTRPDTGRSRRTSAGRLTSDGARAAASVTGRALLRRRVRRPPAPRRPAGVAGLPGRGLGRSGPPVPRGAAGPAAAGRRAGGGGGGGGLPRRRAGVHPFGDAGGHIGILGALAGRRRVGRHLVHSAVEHSSVLHAAERPRGARAARCRRGAGGPVRAGWTPRRRRRAAGRTPRWPACSPPTTRWAPCSRSRRWPRLCPAAGRAAAGGRRAVAGLGAGARPLVAAGGERPQVGRPAGRRAARGPQGHPVRAPAAPGRAGVGPRARLREPPGDRGGGGLPAGGARPGPRRRAPGCGAWWTGSGRRVARAGAGRGGRRRPGPPAAAPGHLLLSLRGRGERCCTSWTGPASRSPPAPRARLHR